jgi:hypothetical protein
MSNNSHPQTSPDITLEQLGFVHSLVKAITGTLLEEIPTDSQPEIIQHCLSIYENYIVGYFKEHFEAKDATRIQQVVKEGKTDIFETFPELKKQFDEAYASFIQYLSTNSQEEK